MNKDDYRFQQERITNLVHQLEPSAIVNFDPDRVPTFIRLRVDERTTGARLIVSSGDYHVSEIADKTDDEVIALLKAWSGGRIR
jgi:hypothetical protein